MGQCCCKSTYPAEVPSDKLVVEPRTATKLARFTPAFMSPPAAKNKEAPPDAKVKARAAMPTPSRKLLPTWNTFMSPPRAPVQYNEDDRA